MSGEGSKRKDQDPTLPYNDLAAAQMPEPVGSGTSFRRIKVTTPIIEPDRDPPGCTVSPTGLTQTNTAGTLLVEGLARKLGLDPATFTLEYGISEEKKQIALYPVHGQTAGAVPVRRSKGRTLLTLYLKPVFVEAPSLRVKSRQQCSMFLDLDAEGNECIVLPLGTALTK